MPAEILVPVLAAMGQWGRKHLARPHGTGYRFIDTDTGELARIGFRPRRRYLGAQGQCHPHGELRRLAPDQAEQT